MKILWCVLHVFILSTAIYAQEEERKKDIGNGFFLNIVLAGQF